MFRLAVALIVVAGIAVGYPLVNEEQKSPCSALEQKIAALVRASGKSGDVLAGALAGVVGSLSEGALAAAAMKDRYPNLPPSIGCTITYWDLIFNPGKLPQIVVPPKK